MLKPYLAKGLLFTLLLFSITLTNLQAQATLSVDGVEDIYALRASFGPNFDENINTEIVLAIDAEAPTSDACTELTNDLTGKIALIDRGTCAFVDKAINAQTAGAIAVVICNNDAANPNQLVVVGGDDGGLLTIPSVGITFNDCEAIKVVLENAAVNASLIPAANNLCVEATAIEPGAYTVDSLFADPVLGGLGGQPSNPGDNDATAAAWYSFTPSADGIMTVNSCEGGADTRLWIHTGSCDIFGLNLVTIAQNDDACIFDPNNLEDEYASFVSLPVQAGITYLIEWDNRWTEGPFDFSLAFEEVEIVLVPGQVCDSAIVIQPNTHTLDTITAYGQTGLYNNNGSQWYSFTPAFNGLMSVSSCGGSGEEAVDSRLFIYEGDCEAPVQIAFSDDACAANEGDTDEVAAFVEALPVIEGTTYLIEWSGRWDARGFDFTLTLDTLPTVEVIFSVDMALETVSEDSVQMVWAYAAPDSLAQVNIATLTDEDGDGKWTTSLTLRTLDTIGYAFVNGALDLNTVEVVPDDCGVDSGFGFNVRPLIVTETETQSVDIVCFGFCRSCGPESCDEPFAIIEDDFESYQSGVLGPQSDFWTTWSGDEGGDEDGIVSADQAASGTNAMKIEGNNGPQDVLLLLGDQTAGHYILSWKMYVPTGQQAYYNIQKVEGSPGDEFGMQLSFGADGIASLDAGAADVRTVSYSQDTWIDIEHYIDLNNDNIRLYVDGTFVYAWPFSWTSFEQTGTKQLGAIDFFPAAGSHLFYVDDVSFAEIPPAGEGQYAHTAVSVAAGTHTVPGLACFGAGFSVRTNGNGGAGYWYNYEATADGYIKVQSCGGGADTRLWVFGGDAQTLPVKGVSDDLCPIAPEGDLWASYREVPVTAGESYLIMFDNVWEDGSFDWSIELVEEALTPGDFCESAIAIEAGTTTIDTLNGTAAVAGPNISFFVADLTNYANSEWYSFTAPADGTMSVYTCSGLPQRSGLYIYDGSCGFDDLRLVATDTNASTNDPIGCDPTAATRGIEVTEGTTYYIEWASKFDGARPGFDFELEFGAPAVPVTFSVDMSILASDGELSAQGAYIGGSFNNFTAVAMDNTDSENIFTFTTNLMKGDTLEYNFFNGPFDQEDIDASIGDNCLFDAFGGRFVIVGQEETTVETVCFGYCVACEATGVEDLAFSQALKVFPNPAQDVTTVQYKFEEATDLVIQLTNSLGQVIATQRIDKAIVGNEEVDLKNLATGIYQLRVMSGERVKTQALVVEH